ncbi:hypothetical protein MNV49_002698 [Pseudohyphozyma bogoriensis]|nr:hypothetical protein MNV49_002698 [Pseudohyphozyma bogoriensis]
MSQKTPATFRSTIPTFAPSSDSEDTVSSMISSDVPPPKRRREQKARRRSLAEQLHDSSDDGTPAAVLHPEIPLTRPNFVVEIRDGLVKRWSALAVIAGLSLAATGTMTSLASLDDNTQRIPYIIATAGRCSALLASIFSTGSELSVLFRHAGFLFYCSLVATAFVSGDLALEIIVSGFAALGVLLLAFCAIMGYKIADKSESD